VAAVRHDHHGTDSNIPAVPASGPARTRWYTALRAALGDDMARTARTCGTSELLLALLEGGPRHLHLLVDQALADALEQIAFEAETR
jgi:hypothetical protein